MKNIGLKSSIIGISKKIHFLDFKNDKLEIHLDYVKNEKVKEDNTQEAVVKVNA